jgi:hypothetical protein
MAITKFYLLPIGEQFRYGGAVFTKNAPLTAIDEQGNQRMIPRSANVEPAGMSAASTTKQDSSRQLLLAATADYHGTCLELLKEIGSSADPDALSHAQPRLESARQELIRRIEEIFQNR